MSYGSYRDTWVEVSINAIQHNVRTFKEYIEQDSRLMAVVKADAYGHGAVDVAKMAIDAGADYLAVAFLDEAIQLRQAGIDFPVLVLGYTTPDAVEDAIMNDITLTVFTQDVIDTIIKIADQNKKTARIHVKIESGMNRIGIADEKEALELIQSIHSPYVLTEGIYTHFADADNIDSTYTVKQFEHFTKVTDYLEKHNLSIPIKHCCNSAGTIAYPEMHLDMVRVGVSLYGLYPDEHLQDKIHLKQAMSFKTKPVMIKTVQADHPISYGCTFSPEKDALIATIPVGYADGFSRLLSNKGYVTVKDKKAPIVGRICMDQSMIDVTEMEDINESDVITIFGEPDEGFISLGEVASQMNTIHYETACLISKRVPRVYINDGMIVKEIGLIKENIHAI
ncbi:alanine racemase [Virgibacillus profundi]|uniref:Alanine racemase n=1 Tax=Virgibacillus profundi TaxID=2024555 RepID=A0A2A2IJZ6_9BACI|nr:alanine racemase [Virgibacillus profundi]PAV31636.1 alanine racemase [Virgibacillus profundi]PXY55822.1 alanine racemase [Virgibacillus profundi]